MFRVLTAVAALIAVAACGARTGLGLPSPAPDGTATEGLPDAVARLDATSEATIDARGFRMDARVDARVDGAVDATLDARVEARADAPADAPADATIDTGVDGGRDAAREAMTVLPTTIPRPISPLSTSRVTRRTPTLHWELPDGVAGATVELCSDRACTMPIGSPVYVTGSSYAPTIDLPIGVVFWRLHPSQDLSLTSPTWELTVGAGNASVDTSWGTTLDVNGDGFADVAVGGPASLMGTVDVYLGSATGLATTPATTLSGPNKYDEFGAPIISAGDVNGDGYADLVVGAVFAPGGGAAYVYLGSAQGLAGAPSITLAAPVPSLYQFGWDLSAGDTNGDGYADILVSGLYRGATDSWVVYGYLGSADGPSGAPSLTLAPPATGEYGTVNSAGDVNGDGYADLLVGVPADGTSGTVYLFLGSAGGLAATPSTTLVDPGLGETDFGQGFGWSIASAGDVNGDGYADVVIATSTSLFVYPGSANGLTTAPTTTLTGYGNVSCTGDLNGDGYADFVTVEPYFAEAGGQGEMTSVYLGGATGLSASAYTLTELSGGPSKLTSASGASAGDINGDGYADLVVGLSVYQSMTGYVYVYLGGATGVVTVPSTTLNVNDDSQFGSAVFGATN